MRKKIVAGNWKMNTSCPEGVELAKAVVAKANEVPANVGLIIAPPFTHLCCVSEITKGSKVELSAQNCADHTSGAYTGEVAAPMLTSVGCQWTILGHSERREYYGETSATLVEKINLAFASGLKVIFCVGEKLEERNAGKHFEVVGTQIAEVLGAFTLEEASQFIIAYEPVWAIGTGKTATPPDADSAHAYIRSLIEEKFGKNIIKIGIISSLSIGYTLYFKHMSKQKLFGELKLRSISYNSAAVEIVGEENASKIFNTAKAIDTAMHKEFAGLKYKDINKIIDNRGTRLPNT